MNLTETTRPDGPPNLDSLVAALTEAAYPVALRHREPGSWIDLELDLWKELAKTVQGWEQHIAQAINPPENSTW
jgi:hypothetical protein